MAALPGTLKALALAREKEAKKKKLETSN